jgi:mono/diheme cytochrome c family protein
LGFTRNPPHAFGAGYTQKLAQEMTITLQELLEKAKASPGKSVALKAKGISFGSVVVTANGKIDTSKSKIEGVSNDLVVRPFQWKGLTSNLRNFITGAMNFHFSIQPTESMLGGTMEDDKDDLVNEIDAGEISAVAIFLSHLRPPVQYVKGFSAKRVKRGEKLFTELDCASCHTPNLTIDNPLVTVRDPRNDVAMMKSMQKMGMQQALAKQEPQQPSLTVAQAALPVMMEYALLKEAKKKGMSEQAIEKKIQARFGGYTRNLNLDDGPAETLPRLPVSKDKRSKIKVPLYSDLKRHKMGVGLAEPFPQTTDGGKDHQVPGDEFLTRPLWGLADTAPWLHDGRALSLTEAIVLHKSDGSDASDSVDKFNALSKADKKALITFLSTLHLPAYNP